MWKKWMVLASVPIFLAGCGSNPQDHAAPVANKASAPAQAQADTSTESSSAGTDFYKGKTLRIVVPHAPGGGYDQWARLLAPYLQKYLNLGKVEVVNIDGGGGLVGTNTVYSATPDGLTIGDTDATGDVMDQISGAQGMKFDVNKFSWIGRPDNDPHTIAVHTQGPFPSFTALEHAQSPVKALATGKEGTDYSAAAITLNAFHIPHTIVAAFNGSKDVKAAFLRGNGDLCAESASDIMEIPQQAKIVAVLSKQPFSKLPGVPTILDLAKQAGLDQSRINALTAMADALDLGHAFFTAPGVPADRLAALRQAFQQALQDSQFQAEASKAGLQVGLVLSLAGAVVVGLSMLWASFPLFLVGMLVFGLGVGAGRARGNERGGRRGAPAPAESFAGVRLHGDHRCLAWAAAPAGNRARLLLAGGAAGRRPAGVLRACDRDDADAPRREPARGLRRARMRSDRGGGAVRDDRRHPARADRRRALSRAAGDRLRERRCRARRLGADAPQSGSRRRVVVARGRGDARHAGDRALRARALSGRRGDVRRARDRHRRAAAAGEAACSGVTTRRYGKTGIVGSTPRSIASWWRRVII
ncbi:MAG: hypothetical protein K6T26_07240, partial [Alicyclobacillus sp.]|nr:hypothetical protein [Alicyclobacillus sp.]